MLFHVVNTGENKCFSTSRLRFVSSVQQYVDDVMVCCHSCVFVRKAFIDIGFVRWCDSLGLWGWIRIYFI